MKAIDKLIDLTELKTSLSQKEAVKRITAEDWKNYVRQYGNAGEGLVSSMTPCHRLFGRVLDSLYGRHLKALYARTVLKRGIRTAETEPYWKWRMNTLHGNFSFRHNWQISDFCKKANISFDTFVFGRMSRNLLNEKFGMYLN